VGVLKKEGSNVGSGLVLFLFFFFTIFYNFDYYLLILAGVVFFFFFGTHGHMEITRLGVKLEL